MRGLHETASLLVLLAAPLLLAQTIDTASVRGRVTDLAGSPVADAEITIKNLETGFLQSARADKDGRYVVARLPVAGHYQISISGAGLQPTTSKTFGLRAGETATLDFRLAPAAVQTTIVVSGTTSDVRTDSPQMSVRLTPRIIENLPVPGNNLTALVLLNSAARPARGTGDQFLNNTLFTINGTGRRQTTWLLDGATANDSWGRQTIMTNLPLPAIAEMNIITSGISAEYGRTAGGVVNVVTKSGTDQFHGELDATFRPGGLEADDPVAGTPGSDKLDQGGALLSGPATGNLHFLVSGQYSAQNQDSQVTSPLAPQTFTGRYRQTLFLTRLDDDLNENTHLMARFNLEKFSDTNPSGAVGGLTLPSADRIFRRDTYTGEAGATSVLSPSLFNEARATWEAGTPITQFQPVDDSTQYVRPGVSVEGNSQVAVLSSHQYQVADTLSYSIGNHFLTVGGDFENSRSGGNGKEFGGPFLLGQFTFNPGISPSIPTQDLTLNDVQSFTQGFGNVSYRVSENLWSLFAQDDYPLLAQLTINAGLRYDRQTYTDDTRMFQPRIGAVWTPGSNRKTAIRGSFGIFYSEVQANQEAEYALFGPTGFVNFTAVAGQYGFPTSLNPLPGLPLGAALPARDIIIRPGRASYYNQFFDVSALKLYPGALENPKTEQSALGIEREVAPGWFVSLDGIHSLTTGILWDIDANSPSPFNRTQPGQVRGSSAANGTRPIIPLPNGYRQILVTTNLGRAKYDGLELNARHNFGENVGGMLSYTWSHMRDNVDPDAPGGTPNDWNELNKEWADSIYDQRHRVVLSGWWRMPLQFVLGGTASAASGRPYNITTGVNNNGDGARGGDRPVVNGAVISRDTGRGNATYDLSLSVARSFALAQGATLTLRVEGFNLTNHANVYGYNGVYGNGAAPLASLGTPLGGVNNEDPGRQFQFEARLSF